MQVCDVGKLPFQANLCEIFAQDQKQHNCGDRVLGLVVLQKTVFISKQDFIPNVGEVLRYLFF